MNKEVKELIDRLKQDSDCEDIYWVGYVDGMNCDVEITSKEMKLLLDCINQLENLVSRETNRRKIATYDYAQLYKKLDDIRAIVSKSLFKTDLVELCRMKNQIIDVLDSIGGSND